MMAGMLINNRAMTIKIALISFFSVVRRRAGQLVPMMCYRGWYSIHATVKHPPLYEESLDAEFRVKLGESIYFITNKKEERTKRELFRIYFLWDAFARSKRKFCTRMNHESFFFLLRLLLAYNNHFLRHPCNLKRIKFSTNRFNMFSPE